MEAVIVEMEMPDGGRDVVGVHPSIANAWSKPIEMRDGQPADRPKCRILDDAEIVKHRESVKREAAKRREAIVAARNEGQRELVKEVVQELLGATTKTKSKAGS